MVSLLTGDLVDADLQHEVDRPRLGGCDRSRGGPDVVGVGVAWRASRLKSATRARCTGGLAHRGEDHTGRETGPRCSRTPASVELYSA